MRPVDRGHEHRTQPASLAMHAILAVFTLLVLAWVIVASFPPHDRGTDAAEYATKANARMLLDLLHDHRRAHGGRPSIEDVVPAANQPCLDAWQNAFELEWISDKRALVASAGPDCEFDTRDDIVIRGRR